MDESNYKEHFKHVDRLLLKRLFGEPGMCVTALAYLFLLAAAYLPVEAYFEEIVRMNDVAAAKLQEGAQKEALSIL